MSRRRPWSCVSESLDEQSHAIDLSGHGPNELVFEARVFLRVGQEDRVVGFSGSSLSALENRREERVAEVGNDDADVAGLARRQGSGGPARAVAELLGHSQDALECLVADQPGLGEGSRHRGRRHVRLAGNVPDRG